MGLLSSQVYADSTLVRANVSCTGLEKTNKKTEEFIEEVQKENELFVLKEAKEAEDGSLRVETKYYQDSRGKMPLNPVDLDARWRSKGEPAKLCYGQHIIVDRGGFILGERVTHSTEVDYQAVLPLLDELPISVATFTADGAYTAGILREKLNEQGITAYITMHWNQNSSATLHGDFQLTEGRLTCPNGRELRRSIKPVTQGETKSYLFFGRESECQSCSQSKQCLKGGRRRKFVYLSVYHPYFEKARAINQTLDYQLQMRCRKAVVEGVLACLKRLGFARARLRGLKKLSCEGFLVALAHNVLKAIIHMRGRLEDRQHNCKITQLGLLAAPA